jgi:hypothetical protein
MAALTPEKMPERIKEWLREHPGMVDSILANPESKGWLEQLLNDVYAGPAGEKTRQAIRSEALRLAGIRKKMKDAGMEARIDGQLGGI